MKAKQKSLVLNPLPKETKNSFVKEGKGRGVILINFNREKLNARRNLRLKISNWIDGYKSIGFKISFLYNTHDSFELIRQFSTRSKYSRDRYF